MSKHKMKNDHSAIEHFWISRKNWRSTVTIHTSRRCHKWSIKQLRISEQYLGLGYDPSFYILSNEIHSGVYKWDTIGQNQHCDRVLSCFIQKLGSPRTYRHSMIFCSTLILTQSQPCAQSLVVLMYINNNKYRLPAFEYLLVVSVSPSKIEWTIYEYVNSTDIFSGNLRAKSLMFSMG